MSRSLNFHYKNPLYESSIFVPPFSFEKTFINCWLPLGKILGFHWVEPQYETYWEMRTVEEVLVFIAQLHQAIEYLSNPANVDFCPNSQEYMIMRANQNIQCLEEALAEWETIDYISML
jgi:hypothetical protein